MTELRAAIAGDIGTAIGSIAFDSDPNLPFTPPADAVWVRLAFQDGAEAQAAFGGAKQLWRQPVLAYADVFAPLGQGDGVASALGGKIKDALRRRRYPGVGRFLRFEQGAEGKSDGDYRYQVVAVFRRDRRV